MKLAEINRVYFLGIGGIGMSALARYFKAMGKDVAGYDKTPTKLTGELQQEGMDIHFEDDLAKVPDQFKAADPASKSSLLVVYTPAVPKSHSEYVFFNTNGFNIKKRSEVLGLITEHSHTIAVAGTHGKTTTSSLIAHILKTAGIDCSAFLGGITQNYETNLLLSSTLSGPGSQLTVVEADEYDRSFLTLHPQLAVITSVDADHLDIYGDEKYMRESYSLFAGQVRDKLVVKKSIVEKLGAQKNLLTYSVSDKGADFYASNVQIKEGAYHYDVHAGGKLFTGLTLGLPGLHNVENSVAAVAIACQLDIPAEKIKEALASFRGVKRRFDYQVKSPGLVFIDDYAHHPEELKACINSVKEMYPGKKITGIFQPHLYTRTRDFADEFARSLDLLDECILMEIYPARELPIKGVSSQMLLDKMSSPNKMICRKSELLNEIANRKLEVLLTLGAGDIDTFVEPIKEKLQGR